MTEEKSYAERLAEREIRNHAIAELEERLKLLRAASRPEPLEETTYVYSGAAGGSVPHERQPSAQGHILSAITKLERRLAELRSKP